MTNQKKQKKKENSNKKNKNKIIIIIKLNNEQINSYFNFPLGKFLCIIFIFPKKKNSTKLYVIGIK